MKRLVLLLVVVVLVVGVGGVSAQSNARSYLILSSGSSLPNNLAQQVASAGGTITRVMPEIGIAVAESSNPRFAGLVRGVRSVVPNLTVDWLPGERTGDVVTDAANPPNSGDDDFFFDLQWGHDSVNAPEAWEAGQRGAGAVVAVLDTGFDLDHPDLAPQIIDAVSFVPNEPPIYMLPNTFSHGTHTSGTIAAADNGFGTIGVAPDARLVLVKVLADAGSGDFDWVIAGILYAANHGDVDIINMSLGAVIAKNGDLSDPDEPYTARDAAELRVAMSRATTYAYLHGVTIFASEGNDGIDKDHTGPIITLPADAEHVISIASVAPIGWATPTWDGNFDIPTGYSNFGRSAVDFAAPGGNFVYPGNENCVVAGLTRPCYVFDYVFSTGNAGWYWSVGTSMAAPHAAGVAAIIVGENGGTMTPAQLRTEMQRRASYGGNTPYYGMGVVNTGY
ncbi:MAG: S8 family serine peptidase [Anaerolineae bacterium]|nr:S8 family serine peptidase [Anaerolineae bacterium]